MESVRSFYRKRISVLLRDDTGENPGNRRRIQRKPQTAAERALSVTELTQLVLQLTPRRTWPTLSLLNWDCAEIIQPQIWQSIACNTPSTFTKIQPHIRKLIHHTKSLNLDGLPQPSLSSILKALSVFEQLPNIKTLSLRQCPITLDQLSVLLSKVPQLKEIDIRGCVLHRHQLEMLAQCKDLESMAFSQENSLLPRGHGQNNIFDLWARLKRLSVDISNSAGSLSVLQIEVAVSQCQLNLESLELRSALWGSRAPTRLSACLRSVTFHTTFNIYTGGAMSFGKHLRLIQASPLVQHVELAGFRIKNHQLKALAEVSPGLSSLALKSCSFKCDGLRHVLDICTSLERLHVHGLEGVYGVCGLREPWVLFKDASWACRNNLQELSLHLVWTTPDLSERGMTQQEEFSGGLLAAMWDALNQLGRLRVLKLRHEYRTDHFGIGILWGVELPRKLERLRLSGHGAWSQGDLEWIAENLRQLDELEYTHGEMDKALCSWIRENRPDVRLVVADAW